MIKTISVTNEHIENGKAGSSINCPVALAIREVCPDLDFEVYTYTITIIGFDLGTLHNPVSNWVEAFDQGRDVAPIEFDLELPEGYCE